MWEIAAIFGVAVLGGAVPFFVRWNERGLHVALALATGVFLGAVFLHLLPEVAAQSVAGIEHAAELPLDPGAGAAEDGHAGEDHSGHDHGPGEHGSQAHAAHFHGDLLPWLAMLVGVLGVYLVEALVLRTHDHDDLHRHRAVSIAALLGLAVHALMAGLAYASMGGIGQGALLLAILAHKGFESFSLTTIFQLAHFKRSQVALVTIGFALVTPIGILLGDTLASGLGRPGINVLNALAAGTFLYVCLCELLSEVFHHREDGAAKMALLAVGVATMWFAHSAGI